MKIYRVQLFKYTKRVLSLICPSGMPHSIYQIFCLITRICYLINSFTEDRRSYAKIKLGLNNWYDGIVKHKVIDDDVAYDDLPTPSQDEFNRYMGKIFWETTTNGGQKIG